MNKFHSGYPPRHLMLTNIYVRQQLNIGMFVIFSVTRLDLDRAGIYNRKKRSGSECPQCEFDNLIIRNREVKINFQILKAYH